MGEYQRGYTHFYPAESVEFSKIKAISQGAGIGIKAGNELLDKDLSDITHPPIVDAHEALDALESLIRKQMLTHFCSQLVELYQSKISQSQTF
jgi:hypothetical protein